jgi:hypothetical protein
MVGHSGGGRLNGYTYDPEHRLPPVVREQEGLASYPSNS